jgi:hypothetical protein
MAGKVPGDSAGNSPGGVSPSRSQTPLPGQAAAAQAAKGKIPSSPGQVPHFPPATHLQGTLAFVDSLPLTPEERSELKRLLQDLSTGAGTESTQERALFYLQTARTALQADLVSTRYQAVAALIRYVEGLKLS